MDLKVPAIIIRLRPQSMRCGLPLVKTGGTIRKAGRTLNCMLKTARMLRLRIRISPQSTSGKKSLQIFIGKGSNENCSNDLQASGIMGPQSEGKKDDCQKPDS